MGVRRSASALSPAPSLAAGLAQTPNSVGARFRGAPNSVGAANKRKRKSRSDLERCGVPKNQEDCKTKIAKFVPLDNADLVTELEYTKGDEVRLIKVWNAVDGVNRVIDNYNCSLRQFAPGASNTQH